MPVVAIGLNGELVLREYKIGLESAKERLVHFKRQSQGVELITQGAFNIGHLVRQLLAKACLSDFVYSLSTPIQSCLTKAFTCFGRALPPFLAFSDIVGPFTRKYAPFLRFGNLAASFVIFIGCDAASHYLGVLKRRLDRINTFLASLRVLIQRNLSSRNLLAVAGFLPSLFSRRTHLFEGFW